MATRGRCSIRSEKSLGRNSARLGLINFKHSKPRVVSQSDSISPERTRRLSQIRTPWHDSKIGLRRWPFLITSPKIHAPNISYSHCGVVLFIYTYIYIYIHREHVILGGLSLDRITAVNETCEYKAYNALETVYGATIVHSLP